MDRPESPEEYVRRKGGLLHNRQIISYKGTGLLITSIYADASEDPMAKHVLLNSVWSYTEQDMSCNRGWSISIYGQLISINSNISDEAIAETIKQEAARGSVLAEKAIIEIARRKLSGHCKN